MLLKFASPYSSYDR